MDHFFVLSALCPWFEWEHVVSGSVLQEKGQLEDAAAMLKRVLALQLRDCQHGQGDEEMAISKLEEMAITKLGRPEHTKTVEVLNNLAL